MKKLCKLLFVAIILNVNCVKAQGIITSSDNNVNAINASSGVVPKTESGATAWTSTNAYLASPLIYRSRRFPDNGTGVFPFNEYGELMIQGNSHDSGNYGYNKGISFLTWDGSSPSALIRMRISPTGNIGIGVISPTNKLDVNGTIHSKEVKVDLTGWSDFVFKKDYDLPTLKEVEKQIKEKGHLENVPSEEEVLKNGINLGEMNSKLLQKIEELTLYLIEQNKRLDNVEKENEELKKEINSLKKI